MGGEWRESTVVEIAAPSRNSLVGGPFGSNLVSRDYTDEGVPVIRGQNMRGRWVSGDFVFVTHAKAESLQANLAYPGDIVFTQRGTLGQVSLIPDAPFERYLVSQSQMKLTVDPIIADSLFFYYVFSSSEQRGYILQHAIQTGVPHTNLGILSQTPIRLPPLSEQRAIAHILGTLDDKIELNQRMNETMEAMARALFKSWFIDFDPVRAKAEGRDPDLPKEIADLFPDQSIKAQLGEIRDRYRGGNWLRPGA
jgi:type I restriction enzyme S subunit